MGNSTTSGMNDLLSGEPCLRWYLGTIKRRRHACDQHFIIIGRDFKIFFCFLQPMLFKLILEKKLVFILLLSLFTPSVGQTQPQGTTDLPGIHGPTSTPVGSRPNSMVKFEKFRIESNQDRKKMINPVQKIETPDRSPRTRPSETRTKA